MSPKVKICCISSIAEAELALSLGADALGFVGPMPSGPGILDISIIANIVKSIPSGISSFYLTSKTTAQGIFEEYKQVNTTTLQLVDHVNFEELKELRLLLGHVAMIVQVVHVLSRDDIQKAKQVEPFVDAILLDSGNPSLSTKELGGTGRTHDWQISRELIESITKPVYLAGGIRSSNLREAYNQVKPYGIDLCSGVRTEGKLDKEKLREFFSVVSSLPK